MIGGMEKTDRILAAIETLGQNVYARFEQIDARITALENKMDARFDQVDKRLDALEKLTDVAELRGRGEEISRRQPVTIAYQPPEPGKKRAS